MSDNLDVQLGETGKGYCNCVSLGVLDKSPLDDLVQLSIRRYINTLDSEDCDGIPVGEPIVACPPDLTLQPDYPPFDVGDPVASGDLIYGGYATTNTVPPAALDIINDIIANPGNYTNTTWPAANPVTISVAITSWHIFRTTVGQGSITILDATLTDITFACNIITDGGYNYYILPYYIAPSNVQYTIL